MSDESPETPSREAAPRRYKGLPPSGPCSRLLHLCDREEAAQEDGFVGHVLRDRCGALDRARVKLLCGTWTLLCGRGGGKNPSSFFARGAGFRDLATDDTAKFYRNNAFGREFLL